MTYVTMRQRKEKRRKKRRSVAIASIAMAILYIVTRSLYGIPSSEPEQVISVSEIPDYDGKPYVVINNNIPYFSEEDYSDTSFEIYSELDELGRCRAAFANVGRDIMPTEPRGDIGKIKPSGWNQVKYEGIVESNPPYLYNRCHLIAYCLTAENANEKNLITGTRYMNVEGMLPFEKRVAKYLDNNDNHVLYRVTPIFEGKNLVANGVLIEAYSIEDEGNGICFCVYCYNVQPDIKINYTTGESMINN